MPNNNSPAAPLDASSVEAAMAQGDGVYFGTRWDAPAFADAVQVAVPVGAVCLFCVEKVEAEDSGTFTGFIDAEGASNLEAVHIECWLRSILGCLSHLQRRCSCYGGTEHEGHSRKDARAVMDWLMVHSPA
jgi:hypothetical protein